MASNRFYLACLRDNVGDSVAFHCKNGNGYSTDIDRAHECTLEEAQKAWNGGREFDLPLCADKVDAQAQARVDCQKLPTESVISDDVTSYVGFQRGRWCGNDVFWLVEKGLPTINFHYAQRYERPGGVTDVVWLPFEMADKAKRRTLDTARLNRRKMVQAAGLITPDHIKRYRRRQPSDKIRFNCPSCGRIAWQLHPYEFDGCSNTDCDKYSPFHG